MHLLPRRAAMQRANDALWLVGLGEERFRPVGTMSTGQRQRVKLATAIAHDPELVLLDEPTDGLDPIQRTRCSTSSAASAPSSGMHIVVSSHHLEEVERICDAVVIVEGGEVVHAGALAKSAEARRARRRGRRTRGRAGAAARRARLRADLATASLLLGCGRGHDEAVRDAVAELGVGLRRLGPRGRTLEDVYMGAGRVSGQDARLFDLGYRSYDGPRARPARRDPDAGALHRSTRAGARPRRPAQGAAGDHARHRVRARAHLGRVRGAHRRHPQEDLITYGKYTFFIGSALALFAALVAPEALCPDRRSRDARALSRGADRPQLATSSPKAPACSRSCS